MGLQVWLPLNGDLRQQGLSNWAFNNTATSMITVNTSGKIGSCYNFNSTATNTGIYSGDNGFMSTYINNRSWSLCAWVQTTATDTCVMSLSYGLRMFAGTSPYITLYNSSRTINCYSSVSTTNGAWHHLAATYNTTNNEIKFYVDGVNTGNNTYTSGYTYASSWVNGLFIGKDPNNSTVSDHYLFKGKMNDIRIYDHTLSPREVKELARGLRVHYKLNDLCSLSSTIDPTGTWSIYNNYSVPASLTATGETYLGSPVRRLSMTPTEARLSHFRTSLSSHGVYNWRQTFAANTKYCFWIYYRPVSHTDVRVGGTASNIGGWTEIAPEAVGDGWYRVGQYRNGTVTEAKTDNIFVSFYCPSAEVDVPVVIDFACPTLIVGYTTIQPFLNYNINNTIVYDVSGLNNNGTILNSITTESSPTRYAAAALFNGTNAKIRLPVLDFSGMTNTYTFSWWQYNISTGNMPWGFSNGNRLNVYHTNPLCWNTGDGSNNQFKDGSTTIAPGTLTNAWHHMAVTGDGTSTKLYIDGVYRGTATTYKPLTGTQIYISGWDTGTSYTFNGCKISDFRIYSTTLSQDDIRELYATSAEIDRRGAFYTRELVE